MLTYLQLQNRIITALLLIFFFSFAQVDSNVGQLSVQLNSPGFIYLNEEFIANHSVEKLNLKPGEYQLSVYSSKSKKWNERGYDQKITILPDQDLHITIDHSDLIYINSIPYGSTIVQDDIILGTTPAFISTGQLSNNSHLMLQKQGYYQKEFQIDNNQQEYLFTLKPETVNHEMMVASSSLDNSQASWYKEGFIVLSLVSSWAAFYFKREADKNYEKYQTVGNPQKMNDYYNRTRRFDTYSDISISVSLTSLGTYMYFLIFD